MHFSLFCYCLPLEQGVWPPLLDTCKLKSSSKNIWWEIWLNFAQWLWRRKNKCEKFLTTMIKRTTTDQFWSEKHTQVSEQKNYCYLYHSLHTGSSGSTPNSKHNSSNSSKAATTKEINNFIQVSVNQESINSLGLHSNS